MLGAVQGSRDSLPQVDNSGRRCRLLAGWALGNRIQQSEICLVYVSGRRNVDPDLFGDCPPTIIN